MATTLGEPVYREGRFPRLVRRITALSRHRVIVMTLVVAAIAGALVLDVAFPSYPIAGFYLVPVTLAALTLRVRETILVSIVCLGLALYVIVIQDRWDGPTITVVCFSVLSGAALIALSYLFKQVDQLYETERSTTDMLESLAAQLQTLQEVVVLDSDRPLSDLLGRVIDQASQLLGSDGCCVYRYDPQQQELEVAAASGASPCSGTISAARTDEPIVRALAEHAPVAVSSGESGGALLAVPLLVRSEAYGVLALTYREERDVQRPGRAPRRLVRRPGRAGHRERPPPGRDRPGGGGHRALAAGARPARLRHAVAVRREPQGRGHSPPLAARPATRRATTSRTWSGSRAARSPRCARC